MTRASYISRKTFWVFVGMLLHTSVIAVEIKSGDGYERCIGNVGGTNAVPDRNSYLFFKGGISASPLSIGLAENASLNHLGASFTAVRRDHPSGVMRDRNGNIRQTFQLYSRLHGMCLATGVQKPPGTARSVQLVDCDSAAAESWWLTSSSGGLMTRLLQAKQSFYATSSIEAALFSDVGVGTIYTLQAAEQREQTRDFNFGQQLIKAGTLNFENGSLVVGGTASKAVPWFCSGPNFSETRLWENFSTPVGSPWRGGVAQSPIANANAYLRAVGRGYSQAYFLENNPPPNARKAVEEMLGYARTKWPSDYTARALFYRYAGLFYTTRPSTWLADGALATQYHSSLLRAMQAEISRDPQGFAKSMFDAADQNELARAHSRAMLTHIRMIRNVEEDLSSPPAKYGLNRQVETRVHRALLAANLTGHENAEAHDVNFWAALGYSSSLTFQTRLPTLKIKDIIGGNFRAVFALAGHQANTFFVTAPYHAGRNGTFKVSLGGAVSNEWLKFKVPNATTEWGMVAAAFASPFQLLDINPPIVPEVEVFTHWTCQDRLARENCKFNGFTVGINRDSTLASTPNPEILAEISRILSASSWLSALANREEFIQSIDAALRDSLRQALYTHSGFYGLEGAYQAAMYIANANALFNFFRAVGQAWDSIYALDVLEAAAQHVDAATVDSIAAGNILEVAPWYRTGKLGMPVHASMFAETNFAVSWISDPDTGDFDAAPDYIHYSPWSVFAQGSGSLETVWRSGKVSLGTQARVQGSVVVAGTVALNKRAASLMSNPAGLDLASRALATSTGGDAGSR